MMNEKLAHLDAFDGENIMKLSPLLRFGLAALVLVVLPSCGLSFRSAWKRPAATTGAAGKWEGTWHSVASGHTGKLRAVIAAPGPLLAASKLQPDAVPQRFFYHCTWGGILRAAFETTPLVVKQKNASYTFTGDHQMPRWVGGNYHYEGTIKGDNFNACYKSTMDHGTFTMKRAH